MLKVSIKSFINPKLLLPIFLFVILGVFLLKPYINFKSENKFTRTIRENVVYSANLADFLFTPPQNLLYGSFVNHPIAKYLRDETFNVHYTEHSLFAGVTVYLLVLFAALLVIVKKNNKLRQIVFPLFFLLGFSVVLSFGPYIFPFGFKLPSLYLLLYKFFPFVDTLRVPSRFMIIAFFAMANLAAISTSFLLHKSGKLKYILAGSLIFLISLEYWQHSSIPYRINPEIKQFYSWVDKQKDTEVILELPIGNQLMFDPNPRKIIADSFYLLYGIYHNKKIINGYNGYIPPDYVRFANYLTLNSVSRKDISDLKKMRVDLVIVHLGEYEDQKIGHRIIKNLERMELEKVYDKNLITAFKINK